VNIFTRRSEWDYNWLKDFPSEVSLCHRYEHARYALLCAAPDPRFVFPRDLPFGDNQFLWGPVLCLLHGLPEKIKFPQMPYRDARELLDCQPETLAAMIDEFSHPAVQNEQTLTLPSKEINRQQAEEIIARFKRHLKRGAGARIRQERTDLKYLGATKLLDSMKALEAIAHTAEALGRPLFSNESEWSRAQKRARTTLEPYYEEATDQYRVFFSEQLPPTIRLKCFRPRHLSINWL
jgi:hypothetical protein